MKGGGAFDVGAAVLPPRILALTACVLTLACTRAVPTTLSPATIAAHEAAKAPEPEPEPETFEISLRSATRAHIWAIDGANIIYNYRLVAGSRLPDVNLQTEYLHFNEVGGTWPVPLSIELIGAEAMARPERRALDRAIAPYRPQLEACHRQHNQANNRVVAFDWTTTPPDVLVSPDELHEHSEASAAVERCFSTVLAKIDWPAATPEFLLFVIMWR